MRPILFHQIDPRISFGLQIPLLHECTKIGGTQTAVVGVDRERVYLTQCVFLGSTNTVYKEEMRCDVDVHQLPSVEKNDYQKLLPTPQDQ